VKLREVVAKLQEIKNRGFIPSLRRGSTGIGYTFETVFGIQENNIPIPDIGGRVEIKTIRRGFSILNHAFYLQSGCLAH